MCMEGRGSVNIGERISILFEHKVGCPACGSEADLTVSEYKSMYETLVLVTLKCGTCGYRKSDVIPIVEEDENKCIEIRVEDVSDLNTLIYVPPGSKIEVPELSISFELSELTDMLMGSYTTVEGILVDFNERLEDACAANEIPQDSCSTLILKLRQAAEGRLPLTVRVTNSYGNVKIVRTYRNNFARC